MGGNGLRFYEITLNFIKAVIWPLIILLIIVILWFTGKMAGVDAQSILDGIINLVGNK